LYADPQSHSSTILFEPIAIPKGAWDTHIHISMQDSSPAPLVDVPSRQAGIPERKLRGLATLNFDEHTNDDLGKLHAVGVRGTRLHLMTGTAPNSAADMKKRIEAITPRVAHLNWVIDIFCPLESWAGLTDYLLKLDPRIKIIADHFGSAYPGHQSKAEFQAPLHLIIKRIYIKLAAFERLYHEHSEGIDTLGPIAKAIINAGPDKIMYASDWPHTQFSSFHKHKTREQILTDIEPFRKVPNGLHIEKLRELVKDYVVWRKLWVDNPNRVFE
jgi:predicted TIM-barrel fold metal-dependent hydrolase